MPAKISRALIHIPVGMLNVFLFLLIPELGIIFGIGFMVYEVMQDWRIADRSYFDVRGWLIGLGIFGAVIGIRGLLL